MLTGQAKIDFDKWMYLNYKTVFGVWGIIPEIARHAFALEWLRDAGIEVIPEILHSRKDQWVSYSHKIYFNEDGWLSQSDWFQKYNPDFNTALTQAIEKACEIYNGWVEVEE